VTAANLHLRWAELLVDGLVASGVREAVVSPGSRSTPLVLALAGRPEVGVTVLVDERVAGFVALGQARATGRPCVLVCTSGTAGAHYLPAVLEADEAGIPLVVVTADRPPELHHRQAAQTTVQGGLFAGHVRLLHDLGVPSPDRAALAGVRVTAALAVARALGPPPGPVHLNAPFRKPLEPVPDTAGDAPLAALTRELRSTPLPPVWASVAAPDPAAVRALAAAVRAVPRGVILAGPARLGASAAVPAIEALAERLGYPILAETTSQVRQPSGGSGAPRVELLDLLAPDPRVQHPGEPGLVLSLGRPVTSATWQRFFEGQPRARRWVLGGDGWPDPWGGVAGIVSGEPARVAEALVAELGPGDPGDPAWASEWLAADRRVREAVGSHVAGEREAGLLSELAVARAVTAVLSAGALLAVGNSLAVREVDLAPPPVAGVGVLHQRGVAGIDGLISGAAGAAGASGRSTVVLLGDLAALHDLGGLAAARLVRTPLVIVVLANRGGRLFELLPLAASGLDEAAVERLFITPADVRLADAAAAFGVPSRRVATAGELDAALREALDRPGASVVEAVISGPGPGVRWRTLRERARAARRG
jgi:2-succinyl-5-enolpyruvyl-6-hydroxy-3-cyclohexene-1-carboxylate synthase